MEPKALSKRSPSPNRLQQRVDIRLIKGAALEHGDDVAGAAEFIINEVLEPQEKKLASQGRLDAARAPEYGGGHAPPGNASEIGLATALVANQGSKGSEGATVVRIHENREPLVRAGSVLVGNFSGTDSEGDEGESARITGECSLDNFDLKSGFSMSRGDRELLNQLAGNDHDRGVNNCEEQRSIAFTENGSSNIMDETSSYSTLGEELGSTLQVPQEEPEVQPARTETVQDKSASSESFDSAVVEKRQTEEREVIPGSAQDIEDSEVGVSSFSSAMDGFPGVPEESRLQEVVAGELNRSENFPESALEDFLQSIPHAERASESGHSTTATQVLDNDVKHAHIPHGSFTTAGPLEVQMPNNPISGQSESAMFQLEDLLEEVSTKGDNRLEDLAIEDSSTVFGMINSGPPPEVPIVEQGTSDAKLFMSMNSIDAADWENIHSGSIRSIRMEILDDLVEEAKSEKEDLINSIEEIRALRMKTDQAEYVARYSKAEAERGGAEVFLKVEEMRQLLSKAREANAVHAGEVCGEKAVLATEARELQMRLFKVKEEKAKALSALNEIKSFLQARFENANREHEAAKLEKVSKEALAREALAIEESLMAQVAQESRELEAEFDACTKLREFLFDRGAIVDALQGEVAVLWEDAEALKKDLDGLSLSCSGTYVHMLSRQSSAMLKTLGSNIFNNTGADFSRPLSPNPGTLRLESQQYEQLGCSAEAESGVSLHNSSSDAGSQIRGPSSKFGSDKRSWSSIPSLIGALSGSQDLTNSSHSAQSNNSSSSRNTTVVIPDENSPYFGTDEFRGPSSSTDTKQLAAYDAPQEVSEVRMAMFPGEELEPEYSGNHTLDIFRVEKSNESDSGPSEDWHLLDRSMLSKGSSGSSSSSSIAGK